MSTVSPSHSSLTSLCLTHSICRSLSLVVLSLIVSHASPSSHCLTLSHSLIPLSYSNSLFHSFSYHSATLYLTLSLISRSHSLSICLITLTYSISLFLVSVTVSDFISLCLTLSHFFSYPCASVSHSFISPLFHSLFLSFHLSHSFNLSLSLTFANYFTRSLTSMCLTLSPCFSLFTVCYQSVSLLATNSYVV